MPTKTFLSRSKTRLKRETMRCRVPVSDCEDCIQEAWLALGKAHPDWQLCESKTLAWLIAVTRNHAMMIHRRIRRHPCRNIDDVGSIPSAASFSQSGREIDQDDQHQGIASELQDGLTRLAEVNREIVIQRAQQGLTYREIGERLGLTAEQVRLRYCRASQALRRRCGHAVANALKQAGKD
jgi:RNA polymerase sigma factor (sigma-70 family)